MEMEFVSSSSSRTTPDIVEESEDDSEADGVDCTPDLGDGKIDFIPECPPELKPRVGMVFCSVKDAIDFYNKYAVQCKFDVRLGGQRTTNDGTVINKAMMCNKEGFCRISSDIVLNGKKRRTSSQRTGCQAYMYVKWKAAKGYVVKVFIEDHNHEFATEGGSQFLKSSRNLTDTQKGFIVDLAKINIGPCKAHKILKELVGGFNMVGAQADDFRNFHRDVVSYIGKYDAQMVLDKFAKKKELCSSFYYDSYVVEGTLQRIFWADAISQLNYHTFGDVVSFDATYSLNRYNMIFVPFTGVDNHKRSITFAAALVCSEDVPCYTWILEAFLKCMGSSPAVVLTDQDPALRVVIPKVLPSSVHRFCIWHIMKKMSAKVGFNTPELQQFRRKMKALVYDYHLSTQLFEQSWQDLLFEYDMSNHKWLIDMYLLRQFWVTAYFRDVPLGGLLRTTSRSESENSFYGSFLNSNLTLLEFVGCFDTALESQRHTQAKCDHLSRMKKPILRTPLRAEVDAVNFYSRDVFVDVQEEICASSYHVSVIKCNDYDDRRVYEFEDGRYDNKAFEVSADARGLVFCCTCKLFERVGYLCRHIFVAMKALKVHCIPKIYLLKRWSLNAVPNALLSVAPMLREECSNVLRVDAIDMSLRVQLQMCVNLAADDKDKRDYIDRMLKEMHSYLLEGNVATGSRAKKDTIRELIGADIPPEIHVRPPDVVRTKGCGKRLVSDRDKVIQKPQRPLRQCKTCFEWCNHDSRTCPLNRLS